MAVIHKNRYEIFFIVLLSGLLLRAVTTVDAATRTIGPFTFTITPTSCNFYATPQSSSFAQIDGEYVAVGDVVGVFADNVTVNDGCIGAFEVISPGSYGAMPAYGDDDTTPEQDGAKPDALLTFKIWTKSDNSTWYAKPTGPNTPGWESQGLKEVGLSAISGISADISGVSKSLFDKGEKIYGYAIIGLKANTVYSLHIFEDVNVLNDGMNIPPRVVGTTTNFMTNTVGDMPAGTVLFENPLPGVYDILIDVDGDSKFKRAVDYIDSNAKIGFISLSDAKLGDVSGDGSISAYDAALIFQHTVNLIELTADQKVSAEVSGHSPVSAFDASLILQYIAGLIKKFPTELLLAPNSP